MSVRTSRFDLWWLAVLVVTGAFIAQGRGIPWQYLVGVAFGAIYMAHVLAHYAVNRPDDLRELLQLDREER